jgi:hypothetical protein
VATVTARLGRSCRPSHVALPIRMASRRTLPPQRPALRPEATTIDERICIECGQAFIPTSDGQKTCDTVCSRQRHRAMSREASHRGVRIASDGLQT